MFELLLKENSINEHRLWNLDETGCTPGRDADGNTRTRSIMTRKGGGDFIIPGVISEARNTMLPVVSADSDA